MIFAFLQILKRDLTIKFRHKMELLNPIIFFILITVIFPLVITSDPQKLRLIGPGLIWVSLLFANMLSIEHIFSYDFDDGTLEQMLLQPTALSCLVMAKLIAHWLVTALPLLLVSVIVSYAFFLPPHGISILFLSLLIGSPIFTLIGAIASAMTLGLQNRGILLILMVLPLYIPVLIFGAGAANDACLNLPTASLLGFLGALLTLTLTFSPMAIAAALKISLE